MKSDPSIRRPSAERGRGFLIAALGLLLLLAACKTGEETTGPVNGVELQLDVVPLLLKADTLSSSTVWATLLVKGEPAPDSTAVYFLASPGSIEPVAYTQDGLAVATYTAAAEPGVAMVVAQAMALRDTVRITLY
ncbi:MAG: hypothetical protein GF355_00460 [Candidatus Eisenbacteria bacterium]|nr:hypothetical protein [Candidatus Eisenbacteria bacterium]